MTKQWIIICLYCGAQLQPGPYRGGEWVTMNEQRLCSSRPKRWWLFRREHKAWKVPGSE